LHLQAIEKYQYGTPQHQQREKLQQQEEEWEEELHDQTRNKRILLVDDEPDHYMVYQIVLEDTGYECTSYTDSVKALQEFRRNYYDLVILDIRMPKLDGFALCKKATEIWTVKDNKVYFTDYVANEQVYDTNLQVVQKMIESFET